MSFDLSQIPAKADFMANNPTPAPPTPLTNEELSALRVTQIQSRLVRFFSDSQNGGVHSIKIFLRNLTPEAKADLIAQIEAKGYSCVENGLRMTISA